MLGHLLHVLGVKIHPTGPTAPRRLLMPAGVDLIGGGPEGNKFVNHRFCCVFSKVFPGCPEGDKIGHGLSSERRLMAPLLSYYTMLGKC